MTSDKSVSEPFERTTDLLPVDFDSAVNDKLSCLPRTTGKERSKDGGVQPSLNRGIDHVHIWSSRHQLLRFDRVRSRASPRSLFGAVESSEVGVIHRDDGGQMGLEHALPLLLSNLFAVVITTDRLGRPLLLKERSQIYSDFGRPRKIIEIVLVPRLAEFLSSISMRARKGEINRAATRPLNG